MMRGAFAWCRLGSERGMRTGSGYWQFLALKRDPLRQRGWGVGWELPVLDFRKGAAGRS